MPRPSEIMATAAAFLNDTNRQLFTDAVQLPYFNQAQRDLEKEFELNDVPVTYETSDVINVPLGTAGTVIKIGYSNPGPKLPSNLLEIKELWESAEGQSVWTPVGRREFLPNNLLLSSSQIPQFLIWAWINDEINLIAANQDNDLKIDYVKKLFVPVVNVNLEMGLKYDRCFSYLAYRTAGHCAFFIGENPTRAMDLYSEANGAMLKDLGIATKSKQTITTRRLPFRFGYKFKGFRVG